MIYASGSQATNLQGIWNDSTLPPWSSNYTISINTEMNYWPVFSCNLAEMNEPLADLIRDISVRQDILIVAEFSGMILKFQTNCN